MCTCWVTPWDTSLQGLLLNIPIDGIGLHTLRPYSTRLLLSYLSLGVTGLQMLGTCSYIGFHTQLCSRRRYLIFCKANQGQCTDHAQPTPTFHMFSNGVSNTLPHLYSLWCTFSPFASSLHLYNTLLCFGAHTFHVLCLHNIHTLPWLSLDINQ